MRPLAELRSWPLPRDLSPGRPVRAVTISGDQRSRASRSLEERWQVCVHFVEERAERLQVSCQLVIFVVRHAAHRRWFGAWFEGPGGNLWISGRWLSCLRQGCALPRAGDFESAPAELLIYLLGARLEGGTRHLGSIPSRAA